MTANGLSEKKNSILEIKEWMWKEYTSDTFKDSPDAAWKAKRRDPFSGSTNRGDE